jgi:hypothetical protein
VVVAETDQGRGVLGVIDGFSPRGIEGEDDVAWRKNLLRQWRAQRSEYCDAIAVLRRRATIQSYILPNLPVVAGWPEPQDRVSRRQYRLRFGAA